MIKRLDLSSLSYKISNSNPVYDGNKNTYLLDKVKASEHWAATNKMFSMVEYEVDWYWGIINRMKLPSRNKTWTSELVNDVLLNQLKWLRSDKTITDFTFWFWNNTILKQFDVYVDIVDWYEIMFFEKKTWTIEELPWGYTHNEIVDLLLLKEFLEWKFLIDMDMFPKNVNIPTQFIKLETLWLVVPFNYSAWVRYTLNHKWKYYQDTWMLYPTSMYNNMMVSWWIHTHTASRRYGKTRWMLPQIKVDFLDVQFLTRPKKQVYIAPSTWRLITMKRYLNQAFEKEIWMWLCTAIQSDDSMKMYKWVDGKQTDTILSEIQLYSAQADDVWVGDYYDVCYIDEVERMLPRNPNVLSDVLSIATNEFWNLRLVSTINKQWRYTDFIKYLQLGEAKKVDYKQFYLDLYYKYELNKLDYKKLEARDKKEIKKLLAIDFLKIRKEIQFFLDYTSTRVPWDLVETYNADDKRQIKKILLNEWILSYTTERLCQLPEEVHAVEFEQQIIDANYFEWKKYDIVVVSYDVSNWGAWDSWAVTYRWYDKQGNKLEFFREVKLSGDINSQYDHICSLWREAIVFTRTNEQNKVHLVFDQRWIWFALTVQFDRDKIPVICYQSTSSETWWTRNDRTYNVWKNYSWNLMKFNFSTGSLIVSAACSSFIDEFKHFKEKRTDSWYVKIEAQEWHHDDFVTSWMMANWYIMDVLWGKHTLTQRQKPVEVEKMSDEDNLFEKLMDWDLVWNWTTLVKPWEEHDIRSVDLFGY